MRRSLVVPSVAMAVASARQASGMHLDRYNSAPAAVALQDIRLDGNDNPAAAAAASSSGPGAPRTRNLHRIDYSSYTDELRHVELRIPFESVPVRLLADTSLVDVHKLFISLQLQTAYVTQYGQLVGQVTRRALCETLSVSPHTPSANEVHLLAQHVQLDRPNLVRRGLGRNKSISGTGPSAAARTGSARTGSAYTAPPTPAL